MVDETCQSTGAIYAGSSYNSTFGSAVIYVVEISPSGAHNQLCNITTPWGSTHNSEVLEYEVLKSYSRSISGGTEYYTLYCTFVVYSETAYAIYNECWYTDDGNRYVKTSGSDSALGTTWGVAWKTAGYGFQNIPSGKDLYIEDGLYAGETLSNLNPPQTMKMYIQPDTHDENPCRVFISDGSIINVGTCVTGTSQGRYSDLYTAINRTAISSDCTLATFCMHANDAGGANADIKLKIFRSDGTNYNVVHTSDEWINISGSHEFEVIYPVLSGDYIGFALKYALYSSIKLETTGGSYHHVAGDINTSVPIASCATSSWLYTFGATGLS